MNHLAHTLTILDALRVHTDTIYIATRALLEGHGPQVPADRLPLPPLPTSPDSAVPAVPRVAVAAQPPASAPPVADGEASSRTTGPAKHFSAQLLARINVAGDHGIPPEGDLRLLAVALLAGEGDAMTTPTIAEVIARELRLDGGQLAALKGRMPKVMNRAKLHGVVAAEKTAMGKMGWTCTLAGDTWLLETVDSPWA